MAKKRREKEGDGVESQHASLWLQLAQEEIGLRLDVDESEHRAAMERELQMQARIKAHYPDMPPELSTEFRRRLQAGYFSWESWDGAVSWLEGTKWFRQRSRYQI
jgi:hypothetical protein